MKRLLGVIVLALLLAQPGISDAKRSNKKAQLVFDDYNNNIRWGEWGKAWEYVDPKVRAEHPLTELELKRFEMIRVTEVTEKASQAGADESMDKLVVIQLVSKFTQIERTITDHQHWRWDAETKRYWLVSGLPDITPDD